MEDVAGWQEVGRYVHLNPVRVGRLGLDKTQRAADRIGLTKAPSEEIVAQRLQVLREWKWSSYPAYAGYVRAPSWLAGEVLGRVCGGRTEKARRAAWVGVVTDASRPRQTVELTTLGELDCDRVTMYACVVVGSSQSTVVAGRFVTPRGYRWAPR